jgi:UDP-glucose 4-epimerase
MLVADATLARDVLGWQPRYDQLREIVDTAWSWHAHRLKEAQTAQRVLVTAGAR